MVRILARAGAVGVLWYFCPYFVLSCADCDGISKPLLLAFFTNGCWDDPLFFVLFPEFEHVRKLLL